MPKPVVGQQQQRQYVMNELNSSIILPSVNIDNQFCYLTFIDILTQNKQKESIKIVFSLNSFKHCYLYAKHLPSRLGRLNGTTSLTSFKTNPSADSRNSANTNALFMPLMEHK